MKKDYNYQVCIQCFTYNQSQYITDALNGFTMQQTSFPFIAMIVDDASTDGEQDIIASYVDDNFDTHNQDIAYHEETDYAYITFAQHKTNKNCYIVVLYLKENHYRKGQNRKKLEYLAQWRDNAKYVALCEGDDYWVDPHKLQTQVDFLEANPDYSLCFHDVYTIVNNEIRGSYKHYDSSREVPVEDVIINGGLFCPTASLVYRKELLDTYPEFAKKCHVGDYPLQIYLALKGKVFYHKDVMGCYRIGHVGSWSHNMQYADKSVIFSKMENEIEMLRAFDDYSGYKYTDAFSLRINKYKLNICFEWLDKRGVRETYKLVPNLTLKQRWRCFLIANNLSILVRCARALKRYRKFVKHK